MTNPAIELFKKERVESFFLGQCTLSIPSIEVDYYGDQCGCPQSYCPPVCHIPYSKLTTYNIASYLGGIHSLPLLLSFYQKTIDVINSVKPIIIIRVILFPITSVAASLISVVFSSDFFW